MKYDVDYMGLPEHMRATAERYVEDHEMPGDFMQAVLRNDLVAAYGRADANNTAAMGAWATWLFNECPSKAWGSKEKVEAWAK